MTNRLDTYLSAYGKGFGFEFDNNIMLNWYPERIMRLCKSSDRLLELGIGHGYTTQRFSKFFSQHVVVDGSASVIEQFHQQYPDCNATVVESYFETFEPGQQFDVIVLGFILEHVSDPEAILQRFKQFLAPGGRCFVSVPNGESLHRRFGHAAGLLGDMMALGEGDLALGHERLYSVNSLSSALTSCGYDVVRKEGIFLKPMTTSQLLSLQLEPAIVHAMCEVGIDYPELSCGLLFEAQVETH
ncbi:MULTISPECIES: class I SAM-dependent methyltransferase [unclassified Pseudomonas]|jgi:trans-aconitate methyltransferase|uniref:class I SAM-dependent methyltransferase n=1 Tax=unclassified Pseudomonas TaxID=196821 RepID=UPI00026FB716|nr:MULTISPECIES: class I SAM-dependent methyltransferase [unclassified Pseudomonas]EJN33183.1 methyltransferase family protein [Pseudomonas sp. GM80]KAE9638944.1 class I SAM-dependent methyltransferase [Pseudomonas sp. PB103]